LIINIIIFYQYEAIFEIMDRNEFELFIAEILDNIPAEFHDRAENLIIEIDETEIPVSKSTGKNSPRQIILGLYHGVPITKRAAGKPIFPDKITIYKKSIESVSSNDEELKKTIKRVVLHEIGHYFGLGEDKLHILGY